jgi:DNA-binding transcriptional regulator YhcF (GntR family)
MPRHIHNNRRRNSVADIERVVLLRISTGVYRALARIPNCEQLAKELGANKNTVSKAYQALAERGFLDPRAGRGTFVTKRQPSALRNQATTEVGESLEQVIRQASLVGLPEVEFRRLMDAAIERLYRKSHARVGFIDCNMLDAGMLAEQLQHVISYPVEPVLLADVLKDPRCFLGGFAILVVGLSHLTELEAGLPSDPPKGNAEIVPMFTPPSAESLTQVARLKSGSHVGIACTTENALESLTGLVRASGPSLTVSGALVTNRRQLKRTLAMSDVMLATISAQLALDGFKVAIPVIPVTFRINDAQAQQIADRLTMHLGLHPMALVS